MKSLLTIVILWICVTHAAWSQGKNTGNIFQFEEKRFFGSIGFAGVASQVDGDHYGGYKKLGLATGGEVFVQFHKDWVLQTGIWYTQKGSKDNKVTGTGLGSAMEKYKLNLHYFDVPVIINYVYKETYLLGAGASYNAFFRSKETQESINGIMVYEPEKYKFNRHSAEFLLSAAAMANKNLMLYMRYHYSLTPIRDYSFIATGSGNQLNNYFTFGFSILF
jgi:hypothetical protein